MERVGIWSEEPEADEEDEVEASAPVATPEDVLERAHAARAQWLAEHADGVELKVREMLDSRLESVVAQVMGFDNRWGHWEIDHCNGRSGESLAADRIRTVAREDALRWVEAALGDVGEPPDAIRKAAREEYRAYFERAMSEAIRTRADSDAQVYVERIVAGSGPATEEGAR